jgi:hypothetical protein
MLRVQNVKLMLQGTIPEIENKANVQGFETMCCV